MTEPGEDLMEKARAIPLNPDEKRALRLLLERPVHEQVARPIDVISRLAARRLVHREAYQARWAGRIHDCWETRLTQTGEALAHYEYEVYHAAQAARKAKRSAAAIRGTP